MPQKALRLRLDQASLESSIPHRIHLKHRLDLKFHNFYPISSAMGRKSTDAAGESLCDNLARSDQTIVSPLQYCRTPPPLVCLLKEAAMSLGLPSLF